MNTVFVVKSNEGVTKFISVKHRTNITEYVYDSIKGGFPLEFFGIESTQLQELAESMGGDINSSGTRYVFTHPDEDFVERVLEHLCKEKNYTLSRATAVNKLTHQKIARRSESMSFNMTLNSHLNPEEKKKYRFEVSFEAASVNDSVRIGNGKFLLSDGGKFPNIKLSGDRVKWLKEWGGYESEWTESCVQTTKISKVVRQLFDITGLFVDDDDNGGELFGGLSIQFHRWVQSGKLYEMAQDPETTAMSVIIQKGIERAYELMAQSLKPKDFNIKVSRDVDRIYAIKNAENGIGTLGNSCMAAHNRSKYTCAKNANFYDLFDNVEIVYAEDKNHLIGRALLWHNVTADGEKETISFVDRIYGSEDFVDAVCAWALEKGYYHKVVQSYSDSTITNGTRRIDRFASAPVKLPYNKINRDVPYFDTMQWATVISRSKYYAKVSLSSNKISDISYACQSTSGGVLIRKCSICGRIVSVVEALSAREGYEERNRVCNSCAITYESRRYVKTEDDVPLTFYRGRRDATMPSVLADGRLVQIEVNGKMVTFDSRDAAGMADFFGKMAKKKAKAKPKKESKLNSDWVSSDWVEHPAEAEI